MKKVAITEGKSDRMATPSVRSYRDADKSLARPGRKQATVTEDFEFHISYCSASWGYRFNPNVILLTETL